MNCPKCGNPVKETCKVIDSRPVATKDAIRRRRKCVCGHRFSTEERIREHWDRSEEHDLELSDIRDQLEKVVIYISRLLPQGHRFNAHPSHNQELPEAPRSCR